MEADDRITDNPSQLGGTAMMPCDNTMALIEKLVAQLYLTQTRDVFSERSEMVAISKDTSSIRKASPQPRQLYDKPSSVPISSV